MARYLRNAAWFFVGLFVAFVWLVPSAYAQVNYPTAGGVIPTSVVGPYSGYPPSYNPYLPNPSTGAPSASSVANATGVAATQSGSATVTLPNGVKIPVPVSQTANIAKAAIARAAVKCLRSGPLAAVACAATAAQVANELLDRPVRVCPPPDFFCRPATDVPPVDDANSGLFYLRGGGFGPASQAAALNCALAGQPTTVLGIAKQSATTILITCRQSDGTPTTKYPGTGNDIVAVLYTGTINTSPVPLVPATDAEAEQSLQQKMDADYFANRRLYDAMKRDQANSPADYPAAADPVTNDTPVSVSAPPVTSPERDVSVTQSPKPDGSVDTTTVKERTTVTPTTTGTTQGTVKTTYPSSTTTTTTTINNVTNVSNSSSTVVNNAPAEAATPSEFPKDYNKEVTQQKIADELAGTGAPNLPDLTATTAAKSAEQKTELGTLISELPNKFEEDKQSWFSWVWTPPMGECVPSTGSVHGVSITLDICPTVNKIRDALGWLFALFSAWSIYGLIFRGE